MRNIKLLFPYYNQFLRFSKTKLQSSYVDFLRFKLGFKNIYWPVHKNCNVANHEKIFVGINALIGRPGNYIQGAGTVVIGNYVQFGPNVGILSSNHDLYDQRKSNSDKIVIGNYCWIGMNSVVLSGVNLGTRTIVAAGSVVTKSFPDGFCVIGGVPAKLIKYIDKEKFVPWKDEEEFYGYIPKEEFERKKNKYLKFEIINELSNI